MSTPRACKSRSSSTELEGKSNKRERGCSAVRHDTLSLFGDPAAIRTQDLLLRRQLLYPAELRGHWFFHRHFIISCFFDVGAPRFELGISCSQSRRDNRASLCPAALSLIKKKTPLLSVFWRRRGLQNATFREFSAEIYCFISAVLDTFLKPLTFTYQLLFQTFRVAFRVARSATFADAFSLQRYTLFSTYQIIC